MRQEYNLTTGDITELPDAEVIEQTIAVSIPSVSPRQIRQALTRVVLRQAVEDAVAAGDQDTKDWWEFSSPFERDHQVVIAMGIALGVSETQLDDLWLLAGSL